MAEIAFENFAQVVRESWRADTSEDPLWTPDQPSLGHSQVTALVIDDYFAGRVVAGWALIPTGGRRPGIAKHYYNMHPWGISDLTKEQFPPGTRVVPPRRALWGRADSTEFGALDEDVYHRYVLLGQRVAAGLLALTMPRPGLEPESAQPAPDRSPGDTTA